ncbi:MAG: putative membrane protein YfcA, partial [Paracoccaceae bacterium]
MHDLQTYQYALIGLIFVWSGFVRSGLGFGGAVLSLPFLLLVHNDVLVFLPLISVHLLVFSFITVAQNNRNPSAGGTVDWRYLRYLLAIMIVPKLIGVFGLVTLPAKVLSGVIFSIVLVYSLSYIFNRPFKSNSRFIDTLFL